MENLPFETEIRHKRNPGLSHHYSRFLSCLIPLNWALAISNLEKGKMKEKDYKLNLSLLKEEVKKLEEPNFINVDEWYLSGEPLNGVSTGYAIEDQCARKLIHYIGLKHGLLVLCPNDAIGIDVKSNNMIGSYIKSDYGKLQIKP